jgi:DNA-binding transcriptional MerR regulator
MGDERASLTIGQMARRTGMPVRTIRYWSDVGLIPAGRSDGGLRLYDAGAVARLELVRTLRELGVGLAEVQRVLDEQTTVAEVAAAHVRALDAQIRTLGLRRGCSPLWRSVRRAPRRWR